MIQHSVFENNEAGSKLLRWQIRQNKIVLGGNSKLKIYGLLRCRSGKKMLRRNRVFFESEVEAIANGFRPCGHCLKSTYLQWKEKH